MSQDRSTRDALLVLGMHRSGTSALTRVLGLLGAELPEHLMQPQPNSNETGFWEPVEIVDTHDELLRSVGSSWDDVAEFPRHWFGSRAAEQYADRLAELVLRNYHDAPLIVLKDPRICRFLPLWLLVLERVGVRPHFAIPIRNPLEVAASLKRRDGFPLAKSALLWLRHVLDAERDSRGYPRAFVEYDHLLADWKGVTDRLGHQLGLTWPGASHRATVEIEAFLSDALRHNRASGSELRDHAQVVGWVKSAYAALRRLARGDTQEPIETFDRLRMQVDRAELAYGPVIADARIRIERAEAELRASEEAARSLAREKDRSEAEARAQLVAMAIELNQARHALNAQQDRMAREREQFEADRRQAEQALEAERQRLRDELDPLSSQLLEAEAIRDWLRRERGRLSAERDRDLARFSAMAADLARAEAEREAALADRQAVHRIFSEHMEAAQAAQAKAVQAYHRAEAARQQLEATLAELTGSRFWRYSRPARAVGPMARRARARLVGAPLAAARRLPGPLRKPLRRLKRRIDTAREDRRVLAELSRSGLAFPSADRPTVSIVIPVHNHYRETVACLQSIREHVAAVDYEVIVVDDASTDPTPRALALVPGVVAIRNAKNLGFIGSCNAGAAQARGEFLAFLNNDTVVTPGWLEELVRTLREEPDAGLAGSRLIYPDGRLQEAGGIIWRDAGGWNFGRGGDPNDPEYSYARDCDYCSGASILIRRALFDELGGFDSHFAPAYYEDTDLAFRVRGQGLRVIYQPLSVVVHFEGLSSGTDLSAGVKAHQVTNRKKFREKWADVLAHHPPGDTGDPYERVAPRNRVLVIDHIVPTPDQDAGSLRMFRILQILRSRGLAVTFIPHNLHATPGYTQALQRIGVKVLHYPYIASVREYLERHGHRYMLAWICRPDIVAQHLEDLRLLAPKAKVAFDTIDLHFVREAREAALLGDPALAEAAEARKAQELALAEASDFTVVVSPTEADLLRDLRPGLDTRVVTLIHEPHHEIPGYADRRGIVFIGGFNHPPNVDAVEFFVRNVFPEVRRRLPGVTFTIIGSHPPDQVRDLACDDVIITGFVPDVTDFFRRCRLSVAPLRYGAGVKGKVNMSMAFGVPVVVTSIAAEGMHLVDGRDVLIADDSASFAEAVVRAYRDPNLWQTLSENGRRNLEEHFSTRVVAREIDRILTDSGLPSDDQPTLRLVGPDAEALTTSKRAS